MVIVHQTGVDGCVIHLVERKPPPLGASSLGLENCMFMCMLQLEIQFSLILLFQIYKCSCSLTSIFPLYMYACKNHCNLFQQRKTNQTNLESLLLKFNLNYNMNIKTVLILPIRLFEFYTIIILFVRWPQ